MVKRCIATLSSENGCAPVAGQAFPHAVIALGTLAGGFVGNWLGHERVSSWEVFCAWPQSPGGQRPRLPVLHTVKMFETYFALSERIAAVHRF